MVRQRTVANVLVAHERAGNVAHEHHFYAAAAQHYQDALNGATVVSDDYNRISQKLIQALLLSGEPSAVNPLCDRLLTAYLATPDNSTKAIEIMLKMIRQRWIDSKTNETLPIITQAMQLAERMDEQGLWMWTNLMMHNYCVLLGRYDEATPFLNNVGKVGNKHAVSLRIEYYGQWAAEAAITGQAAKAYRYHKRALALVKHERDLYRVMGIWHDYSYCATILGDVALAKSCIERALLIARQQHFLWSISHLCLVYASILALMGEFRSAYGYLLEALSADARAPILERAFAEIGIPLALHMNDEATLAKCAHPEALTLAFQSEEPECISSVAAAFAKLYGVQGDREGAQALLHRALEVVQPAPFGWDLPLEVARQGASADLPRARNLLEARTGLPRSGVARACLSLFDAHAAQRESNVFVAHAHAKDARERFEALHWHAYADEARSLLPHVQDGSSTSQRQSLPFTDMQSVLTLREQQVAGFVLRGMTNRAIALELSISENTVETHMSSIMNRLGIRSRYQLGDVLGE